MAIRVATFSVGKKDTLGVAFYYSVKSSPVPKPGFVPAVPNLDLATINALQAGTIIEAVREIPFSGWPLDQIQAELQKEWAIGQDKALADSAASNKGVGMLFDGATWS